MQICLGSTQGEHISAGDLTNLFPGTIDYLLFGGVNWPPESHTIGLAPDVDVCEFFKNNLDSCIAKIKHFS